MLPLSADPAARSLNEQGRQTVLAGPVCLSGRFALAYLKILIGFICSNMSRPSCFSPLHGYWLSAIDYLKFKVQSSNFNLLRHFGGREVQSSRFPISAVLLFLLSTTLIPAASGPGINQVTWLPSAVG